MLDKFSILIILVVAMLLAYAVHLLIKRFIDPRASASHMFLFFLAHFVGIFLLVFLVNFFILHFARYLFRP